MSDENIIEIEDVDLETVETGIPILKSGTYNVRVNSIEKKETKKGGHMLKIELLTLDEAETEGGEPVAVDFPLFDNIGITPTEKYTPKMIGGKLAALMECFLGRRTKALDPEDFVNAEGRVRVIIEDSEQYGKSNRIKAYEPKKSGGF